MTDRPPNWVLIEAAKRTDWGATYNHTLERLRREWAFPLSTFRALCDMIQKYEQPPVDRKLLCAEKAMFEMQHEAAKNAPYAITAKHVAIRAIELWEEGFGK